MANHFVKKRQHRDCPSDVHVGHQTRCMPVKGTNLRHTCTYTHARTNTHRQHGTHTHIHSHAHTHTRYNTRITPRHRHANVSSALSGPRRVRLSRRSVCSTLGAVAVVHLQEAVTDRGVGAIGDGVLNLRVAGQVAHSDDSAHHHLQATSTHILHAYCSSRSQYDQQLRTACVLLINPFKLTSFQLKMSTSLTT